MQNAECRTQKLEILHSEFFILRSAFRMRSRYCVLSSAPQKHGGEWGLVASAVFKTVVSARKRRKVGSIPTRLRQSGVGHDCVVPNFGRGTAQPCPTAYCL